MAGNYSLSEGAIRLIMKGGNIKDPIMQVLASKRIASGSSDEKRFCLLSDGKHVIFAITTQNNDKKMTNGELATNTIIKINHYTTRVITSAGKGNKHILIILEMEILVPGEKTSKIGNPEQLPEDMEQDDPTTSRTTNGASGMTNGHANTTTRPVDVASAVRYNSGDLNMFPQDQLTHAISALSLYENKWVIKAGMAGNYSLSEGALQLIMKGGYIKYPIMQVLGSKCIGSGSSDKERFRLLLSDGKYVISFAMLTTQNNDKKMTNGELATNTIIRINHYTTSVINTAGKGNKHILIILEMEILVPGEKTSKIGNPEQLPEDYMEQDKPTTSRTTNGASGMTNGPANTTSRPVDVASAVRYNSGDLNMFPQDQLTHAISTLSLYQNKWVIKAGNYSLSEGALQLIMKGSNIKDPIMQVLGSKRIASGSSDKERYRLLLSDGKYVYSFAMLTTENNNKKMTNGELATNTIIKINRYTTSVINHGGKGNKCVLIILEIETLVPGEKTSKIGNPEQLPEDDMEQDEPTTSSSSRMGLGSAGVEDYFQVKATILRSKNCLYKVCPTEECNRKVLNQETGMYWCERCRREYPNFKYQLLGSINVGDWSGNMYISMFASEAEKILGMSSQAVGEAMEGDSEALANITDKAHFKQFVFKYRFKMETFNADWKTVAVKVDPINYKEYNAHLISKILIMQDQLMLQNKWAIKAGMAGKYFLSEGALRLIMKGGYIKYPIMQVLGSKRIPSGSAEKERFRLLLSDGKYVISFAVLTAQNNDKKMTNGELATNTIIRINHYTTSVINSAGKGNKCVLIILEMETLVPGEKTTKIGNPEQLPEDDMEQNEPTTSSSSMGGCGFQTPWMSIKETQDQGLGFAGVEDYFQVKDTILLYENYHYKICPTEECNQKVLDQETGMYRCERCRWTYPNFKYALLGSINVGDWNGNMCISMFPSETEKILGMSSQAVGEAVKGDPEALANITDTAHFKQFVLKCRSKIETFNNVSRLKTVTIKVGPINYKEYNAHLISKILSMSSQAGKAGNYSLSEGVLRLIMKGGYIKYPIMQVLGSKRIASGSAEKERFRLLLSDGKYVISFAMLTAQNNDKKMTNGELATNTIIRINHYTTSVINSAGKGNKRVLVILEMETLVPGEKTSKIGNPEQLPEDDTEQDEPTTNSGSSGGSFQMPWMSIKETQDQNWRSAEKGDYFQVKATFLRSENYLYKVCPTEECNKKVLKQETGMYRCERCRWEYPNFKYRWLGSLINVGDWSGNLWMSTFESEAEKILGMSSEAAEADPEALAKL